MMKQLHFTLLLLAALLLAGCSTVPLTGRKQMLLVSDSEVLSSSLTQYNDYIKSAKKSANAAQTAMVVRVGKKIASATEAYLRANGMHRSLPARERHGIGNPELRLGIQSHTRPASERLLHAGRKDCSL